MSNSFAILRALVIYGICLPLAIYLGYSLATPDDRGTLAVIGLILLVLLLPLLLHWHHLLLVCSWNMAAVVFFLPGKLELWIVMGYVSLTIALVQRALNRDMKFLKVKSVAIPLIFIAVVVVVTAWLTGGLGMRVMGDATYGAKRYLMIMSAIAGFFALTSRRIAPSRARWYVAVFFLAGLTAVIPDLVTVVSPSLYFIFLVFPADFTPIYQANVDSFNHIARWGGLAMASQTLIYFLLSAYGIRAMLRRRYWWAGVLFVLAFGFLPFGGFRSGFILIVMTFVMIFYLEGLVRSRMLPALLAGSLLVSVSMLPFMNKLPLAVQRTFSFLPVQVDPVAMADAQASTEWRLRMWKTLLPQVPQYLMLGKGFGISGAELEFAQNMSYRGGDSTEVASLAGDYHNGPLSVIIPLGIWGLLGFIWFLVAAIRVLYLNYQHSPPDLKRINTFLFAYFMVRTIFFFAIYGSLYAEFFIFTGLLGLSISLNGGISQPVVEPKPEISLKKATRPSPLNPVAVV